jgi:glycosyltransferase involved in cell wall biosynthesis
MLAEKDNANTNNWVENLRRYGPAEIEVWSLPRRSNLIRLLYLPIAVLQVKEKIAKFNPDLVIGYRTTSYGFIGALTGFKPLVIAAQGESDVWPPSHWSSIIKRGMAKYAVNRSNLIHAWGKNMARSLVDLGAANNKILIMPRGINLSKFQFRLPFKQPQTLTLIVSRSLFPEYHHDLIIRAFAKVRLKLPTTDCKLIIAGDGILKTYLQELCNKLGIPNNVLFTGRIDNAKLNQYLSEADLYISLPDTEGVSSSLFEAFATGCYPIVTDLPANKEWIDSGKNGLLVKISEDNLADAIIAVNDKRNNLVPHVIRNRAIVEGSASAEVNTRKFIDEYFTIIQKRN